MRTVKRSTKLIGIIAFALAAAILTIPKTAKAVPLPWTWEKASPDSWGVAGTWGGQYDEDGQANGTIVDPAGPAIKVANTNIPGSSNNTTSSNGLAGTGQSIWFILAAALGFTVVAGGLIIKSRR